MASLLVQSCVFLVLVPDPLWLISYNRSRCSKNPYYGRVVFLRESSGIVILFSDSCLSIVLFQKGFKIDINEPPNSLREYIRETIQFQMGIVALYLQE